MLLKSSADAEQCFIMHVLLHSEFPWDNSASVCRDSEGELLTIVRPVLPEYILTCCKLHVFLTPGM